MENKKRPKKYEKKLELDDNVTFDALFGVAIKHDVRKKKAAPKKKKS